jgi:putative ABC transport system permease protein
MLRLALSTLGSRKGAMFGAFAAVTLAVVLVASTGILLESSLRAPLPVERLAGAGIVVQADSTLQPQDGRGNVSLVLPEQTRVPVSLAGRLERIDGVRRAIADHTFAADVVDERGRLMPDAERGHGWSSAALASLTLNVGRPPAGVDDVVVDAGLGAHVGDRLRIDAAAGRRSFTVVGVVPASRHAAVYVRDDVAARMAGRPDLVGLLVEPDADPAVVADRVREALDGTGFRVLTGAKRGEAESLDGALAREEIVAGLTVFGMLAAFVAVFVVSSTFALSVQQRHRELALFRAIGTSPGQVRRMVAGEALVVATLAVIVGAPLGVLFAFVERRLFSSVHMLPSDLHLVTGWMPFAAALLMAIVTTQLAAFASARRASRIRPVDALREAAVQRRPLSWLRGLAGLAALAGGAAALLASTGGDGSDAPAAAMVWMVAAALLGPGLALPFVWLLGLPLRLLGGGTGLLAGANTRANLRRVASIATPLMLTVSLASTILFSRTTIERQTSQQASRSITAEHVLRSSAGGLTPGVAAAARRVRGVTAASGSFATAVEVADGGGNLRSLPARAVDPETLAGSSIST